MEHEKPFYVERAKTGRSGCKKCKQKIITGDLRLGKLGYNPFSSGTMVLWHHVQCMFEVFKKQRKTTKKIESFTEVEGWFKLPESDKDTIKSYFSSDDLKEIESKTSTEQTSELESSSKELPIDSKDNSFRTFRKICSKVTEASSYLTKTSIVKEFFENGSDGTGFKGDLLLWCRNLLPMSASKIYNLQSKQLVKIFSDIFRTSQEKMLEDLEKGDVAETIAKFFMESNKMEVEKKSALTLNEVDFFLEYLSKLTREVDQTNHFKSILPKCTANDLKSIIRLIKHDLRINAGPKHILEALDPKAYPAFQASRDLQAVVNNVLKCKDKSKGEQSLQVGITVMTPVLPMLAEACSSVEMAFRKCPNGMYSEIKYDGERVQLHKQGDTFKYFSRSLKPVLNHKVSHFEKYIPKAFPHGKDLILDSEILMVDTETGNPLPFGTLGAHKKNEFQHATVCLFVFDCIYYNGQSLIDKPIKERRNILKDNMKEITHHVMFSEVQEIHEREDLENMMESVFRQGLEGLVLKPLLSHYEPGKRHWLKVKKDYLAGGSMADTADLVVLGAWFGTGKKGGIMSVFLMGCYDEKRGRWVTVTKVHGGHDDKTLEALQTQLQVDKISKDVSRVPSWLHCAKSMVPDFVAKDPKNSPVWEITGAEFTCNQVHTADGISIRFPRVTRIRNDKSWDTATSLSELKKIYEASKDTSGFTLAGKSEKPDGNNSSKESPKKKRTERSDKLKKSSKGEDSKKGRKVTESSSSKKQKDTINSVDEESSKKHEDSKKTKHSGESSSSSKKLKDTACYEDDTDDDDESNKKHKDSKKRKHLGESSSSSSKKDNTYYDTDDDESKKAKHVGESSSSSKKLKDTACYEDETDDDESSKKHEDSKKAKHVGESSSSSKKLEDTTYYEDETDDDDESSKKHEDSKKRKHVGESSSSSSKKQKDTIDSVDDESSKKHEDNKRVKHLGENSSSSKKLKDTTYYEDETDDDDDESNKKHEVSKKRKHLGESSSSSSSKKLKDTKCYDDKVRDNNEIGEIKSETYSRKHVKHINYDDDTETDDDQKNKKGSDKKENERVNKNKKADDDNIISKKMKSNNGDNMGICSETAKISVKPTKKAVAKLSYDDETDIDDDNGMSIKNDKEKKTKSGSDTEVDEDPVPNAGVKISMKNKLPNIFTDIVIHLHKSVCDKDMLKRFIIAFNGKIFSEKYCNTLENDKRKVTHYVYPSRSVKDKLEIKDKGKHVSVDWLWDSIKQTKCLSEEDFKIKLNKEEK